MAVMMAQRAVCNAFQHQSLQSVLVLHAGTVAAVFGDTGGAENDKLVQVSRGAHSI